MYHLVWEVEKLLSSSWRTISDVIIKGFWKHQKRRVVNFDSGWELENLEGVLYEKGRVKSEA